MIGARDRPAKAGRWKDGIRRCCGEAAEEVAPSRVHSAPFPGSELCKAGNLLIFNHFPTENGGERGIRTLGRDLNPYGGLANHCFKPLSHLSEKVARQS